MIVVDAWAVVEVMLGGPNATACGSTMAADGDWWVPEHFTVEVVSALRGLWLSGQLDHAAFAAGAEEVARMTLATYPTAALLQRMVELAPRVTAYDAAYLALAEALGCPLLTLDRRLRSTTGTTTRFLPEEPDA